MKPFFTMKQVSPSEGEILIYEARPSPRSSNWCESARGRRTALSANHGQRIDVNARRHPAEVQPPELRQEGYELFREHYLYFTDAAR